MKTQIPKFLKRIVGPKMFLEHFCEKKLMTFHCSASAIIVYFIETGT